MVLVILMDRLKSHLVKKKNGEKGNKAINKCQMFWACRHYVTNEKKKEIKKGNKYKIE